MPPESPLRRSQSDDLRHSQHLEEAVQVAYYHCALGMPLKTIATILGKSPATITRRLDQVRRAGWLRDNPEFCPPPDVWRDLQGHMTCSDLERRLMDCLGDRMLRSITILPTTGAPIPEQSREARPENVERVGVYAARRMVEALGQSAHVIGVNWGWSVRHCMANLHPSRPNPDLRFVPVVGTLSLDETDPHFEEAGECSSNRLAQMAAASFDAPRGPRLNTPAYIPRRFQGDASALRAVRDFIEGDTSYRRIFGGHDETGKRQSGLIDEMDTLVSGLTSLDVQTLPTYRPNLITVDDLPLLSRAGVVGDLGLHLLVENADRTEAALDVPPAERALVDTINGLIVGASPADFIGVAQRARRSDATGPGVIVLAVGAWKARILVTAIRLGAVNELITDMETGLAMGRHLGLRDLPTRFAG